MKTWNIPSLEELDVKMTAGGVINIDHETLNDFNKHLPDTDIPVFSDHDCCIGVEGVDCNCTSACPYHRVGEPAS